MVAGKAGLLSVLVLYLVSVNFFYHMHENGNIIVVHSHPYKKNCDGKPAHKHTNAELQLIHSLSSYETTKLAVTVLDFTVFETVTEALSVKPATPLKLNSPEGSLFLRPPPRFLFI